MDPSQPQHSVLVCPAADMHAIVTLAFGVDGAQQNQLPVVVLQLSLGL